MNEVLASINLVPIHHWLSSLGGYHDSVLDDEAHAYLSTGQPEALLVKMGVDPADYREAIERLRSIFTHYSGRTQ